MPPFAYLILIYVKIYVIGTHKILIDAKCQLFTHLLTKSDTDISMILHFL